MQFKPAPSNHSPGPWNEISRENGIRTVEVPDFNSFSQFVNIGFGDMDCRYLWRGQKQSEWAISSTLARTGNSDESPLYNFREAVARCSDLEYDLSDEKTKLKLWSLGQHYGLKTPLIDWTIYPYAALFFAFVDSENDGSKFRSVFALCWDAVKHANFDITETDGMKPFKKKLNTPPYSAEFKGYLKKRFGLHDENGIKMVESSEIPPQIKERMCKWQHEHLKEKRLRIYKSPDKENQRIHSQGGYHIFTPNDESIEEWIKSNNGRQQMTPLVKLMIPNTERSDILKCLNKMNINYLSLFPDYEGAAKHCNLAHEESRLGFGLREY